MVFDPCWPQGLSGRSTSVVKVHTILCLCYGTLENMTLSILLLFVKWTSNTLEARNLKFKTSKTTFWIYWDSFYQTEYAGWFTNGYPLDVQSVASWFSEVERSVAYLSQSALALTFLYIHLHLKYLTMYF